MNKLSEFYAQKPVATTAQRSVLNAYYIARRDFDEDRRIPQKVFVEHMSSVLYETDIAVSIMKEIDDHYLKLRAEKLKRDLDNK